MKRAVKAGRDAFLAGFWLPACPAGMGKVSPQELALTAEGVRQLLGLHDGTPAARLHAALGEALQVVARAIQQTNNRGMVSWLNSCAAAVHTLADLEAFSGHLQAVVRVYGLLARLAPDVSGSPQ